MLSCVTLRNIWRRSKRLCRGFVKGKSDGGGNVVQTESRGKFVHVTYVLCVMKLRLQGVLEYVQGHSTLSRSIRIFIEEWSKDDMKQSL